MLFFNGCEFEQTLLYSQSHLVEFFDFQSFKCSSLVSYDAFQKARVDFPYIYIQLFWTVGKSTTLQFALQPLEKSYQHFDTINISAISLVLSNYGIPSLWIIAQFLNALKFISLFFSVCICQRLMALFNHLWIGSHLSVVMIQENWSTYRAGHNKGLDHMK